MSGESTTLRASDCVVAIGALVFANAAGAIFAWLTAPTPAPEPHYCFRADPPPCEMTVK